MSGCTNSSGSGFVAFPPGWKLTRLGRRVGRWLTSLPCGQSTRISSISTRLCAIDAVTSPPPPEKGWSESVTFGRGRDLNSLEAGSLFPCSRDFSDHKTILIHQTLLNIQYQLSHSPELSAEALCKYVVPLLLQDEPPTGTWHQYAVVVSKVRFSNQSATNARI